MERFANSVHALDCLRGRICTMRGVIVYNHVNKGLMEWPLSPVSVGP